MAAMDLAPEPGIVDRREQQRTIITPVGDKVIDALSGEVRPIHLPGPTPLVACEHESSLTRANQHLNTLRFSAGHAFLLFLPG
jgi:hypothetical protein